MLCSVIHIYYSNFGKTGGPLSLSPSLSRSKDSRISSIHAIQSHSLCQFSNEIRYFFFVNSLRSGRFIMEDKHNMAIPDYTDYKTLDERVAAELSDKNRFVPMQQRQDTGVLTTDIMSSICHGNITQF